MNKKIFISHSTKDKEIVNSFMENILVGALGIDINNIFNTSGCGTGIELGKEWRQAIKEELEAAELVIEFDSLAYKSSEVCQNELGAAIFMKKKIIPVIIPPLNFDNAGILTGAKQAEKINSLDGLDKIKDSIVNSLEIDANNLKTERWNLKKKYFLEEVNLLLKSEEYSVKCYDSTNFSQHITIQDIKYKILNSIRSIIINL